MSRLQQLFIKKPQRVLNVYCTAGYPAIDSTIEVIRSLERFGADVVEVGMPYSDPLADGPVIQASGSTALANGMTIELLFDQLKDLRNASAQMEIPIILMGYMNPVLQFGFERFCAAAAAVGIDALILPDLPEHEYVQEYRAIIKKYGLDFIFLVTPETSEQRIRRLDGLSSGFLYAVSSSSTTGKNKSLADQQSYFERLRAMKLKNHILIGFGISDKASFDTACSYASGAIIGTAYIKALSQTNDVAAATQDFLQFILSGN